MGLIATDVNQTVEFSLAEDQGADKTVFLLRSLDLRERAFVSGRSVPGVNLRKTSSGESADPGVMTPESIVDGTIWAIRLGLKGWRNFLRPDGQAVLVQMETVQVPGIGPREVLTEECVLRNFKKLWAAEICAEILSISELSGDQRKN
jgi:hypothetical protein